MTMEAQQLTENEIKIIELVKGFQLSEWKKIEDLGVFGYEVRYKGILFQISKSIWTNYINLCAINSETAPYGVIWLPKNNREVEQIYMSLGERIDVRRELDIECENSIMKLLF